MAKGGNLRSFVFNEDYVVTNPKVCEAFSVKQLVIKAGKYNVQYPDPNQGGAITFTLKESIPTKQMKFKTSLTVEGTNPKGKNYEGTGNSCFFYSDTVTSDWKPNDSCIFTITPIMTDTTCTQIQVNFKDVGSPKASGL